MESWKVLTERLKTIVYMTRNEFVFLQLGFFIIFLKILLEKVFFYVVQDFIGKNHM